jgi:hypothetical protein
MSSGSLSAPAVMATALFFILATAAGAQEAGAANGAEPDEIEVTTGVLERLVTVYPLVVAIAEDAEPRIANAETEAVARAIEELARDRIATVLMRVDFTPAQYMATVRVLNSDAGLRARFQELLRARWDPASGDS